MSPSRRKPKNWESGSTAPASEPGAAMARPGEADLPANVEYLREDELHAKLVPALKDKANKMFEEAAENPDSEANQLVRILLLNQLANMDPARYQENPRMVVAEERHRGIESERKAEIDRQTVRILKQREAKLQEEIKLAQTRAREMEQKIRHGEYRLAEAERLAQNARAAAEHGAPLDPLSVYTKIAEIIGLQSPAQQSEDAGAEAR